MPKVGDTVVYCMEFDADESYSPNIGPALVTKVNKDGSIDLVIFAENGMFFKENILKGEVGERMKWTVK